MSNTATRGGSATSTKATTADEMKVVYTFVKNSFDEVWAYLQPFRGHDLAHIRVYTLGADDEMRPKKQGIAVNVRDLPKLAEAVAAWSRQWRLGHHDARIDSTRAIRGAEARSHSAGSSLTARGPVCGVALAWTHTAGRIDGPGWRAWSRQVAPQPPARLTLVSG